MNIAQQLQKLLNDTNTSRSKLARAIGVHTSSVSNWIDGKDAKAENLDAICDYFGCSLDYLAGKTGSKHINGPAVNDEANELMREMYERPELRALFKTTKGVKPEDIKYVDDMLKRFKEGYRDD